MDQGKKKRGTVAGPELECISSAKREKGFLSSSIEAKGSIVRVRHAISKEKSLSCQHLADLSSSFVAVYHTLRLAYFDTIWHHFYTHAIMSSFLLFFFLLLCKNSLQEFMEIFFLIEHTKKAIFFFCLFYSLKKKKLVVDIQRIPDQNVLLSAHGRWTMGGFISSIFPPTFPADGGPSWCRVLRSIDCIRTW